MKAVFLGGSRRISRLNESIRAKLDELVDRGLHLFVGDANGADRAIQQHLANRGYARVIVYSVTGALRNNVGNWEVRSVDAPRGARGFELYSAKDVQMAKDAAYGFMLWDGKSRGTLENVRNLLAQGKPVAVFFSPLRRIISLRSPADMVKLGGDVGRLSPGQADLPFDVGTPSHSGTASASDESGLPGGELARVASPRRHG